MSTGKLKKVKPNKKTPAGKIVIDFTEDGKAQFDIKTGATQQIIVALMGLEGYLHSVTGLDTIEIRSMIDAEKPHVDVTPKAVEDGVIDVDAEELD